MPTEPPRRAGGLWYTDAKLPMLTISSSNNVSLTALLSASIGGFSARTTAYTKIILNSRHLKLQSYNFHTFAD
jgi:hypothetical protein